MNSTIKNKIVSFINLTITNTDLKKFFNKLVHSDKINEQQLCLSILIEIKFGFTTERKYIDIIDYIKTTKIPISYQSFAEYLNEHRFYGNEHECKIQYSRVVTKRSFNSYYGSFKNNNSYEIDEEKITKYGWTSGTGIVFVTPKHELDIIIVSCKHEEYPANMVSDYLGLLRTESDKRICNDDFLYLKIDYSKYFRDKLYQPNSSNIDWLLENLFLTCRKPDGFGRTFNENGVEFAKERIHKKSHFFDGYFRMKQIGKFSIIDSIKGEIIDEAIKRLEI